MAVDLLFTVHNRRDFTIASFGALVANTNWDRVTKMLITDDLSTDGTSEWLLENAERVPVELQIERRQFAGPVPAMNYAVDHASAPIIAKIDNDVIVCPRWLDVMLEAMGDEPTVDCLGMEPGFAGVYPGDELSIMRRCKPARFIGGVGLIRTRIFRKQRPKMNDRWFGWTRFQERNAVCAWADPDLPVFLLDHLPSEPWRSFARHYVEQGWARRWDDVYDAAMTERYAGWWLDAIAA